MFKLIIIHSLTFELNGFLKASESAAFKKSELCGNTAVLNALLCET